ncbi:hypothetical protein PUNSTDRAFT_42152 [Punctularia strigosozonata HHB-11173 SS5]|uniref:uncharacterized protein n=1 Tax=Punctularia strigosozonata (strain HHB-11173) TaxID=741275 RepID=UPI0004416CBE|nr:uncharacterized protein PUNSTDRAFT_42152 [Punctularia strigosozonata HHB-11173 SS5]EIN12578.1 hypothetical protein PUNSTDRAFT_42152 [Punctularia strigosozonata HHB-11173 SS5]
MSLVCRATRARCQSYLFAYVSVEEIMQCANLVNVFISSPQLATNMLFGSTIAPSLSHLPDLYDPRLPVRLFILEDTAIDSLDRLAIVLSRMPLLEQLELKSTRIEYAGPEDEEPMLELWPSSSLRLTTLVLHDHRMGSLEDAAIFFSGFDDVKVLNLMIIDSCDYQFLCDMIKLEKGVVELHVVVTERWEYPLYEDEMHPEDFRDRTGGGGLRALVFKQETGVFREKNFNLDDNDGSWTTPLLLSLNTHLLEAATWPGFDWAMVDEALSNPGKFPALKLVEVDDISFELRSGSEIRIFESRLEEQLPQVQHQGILYVNLDDRWRAALD